MVAHDGDLPERQFGWWDMFVSEDDDPRADGEWDNDERSVLLGFLEDRRLTLELKCRGLDAEQIGKAFGAAFGHFIAGPRTTPDERRELLVLPCDSRRV